MLKISYDKHAGGWQKPYITPMEHLHLHPAAKVLHYATEVKHIYLINIHINDLKQTHYFIITSTKPLLKVNKVISFINKCSI